MASIESSSYNESNENSVIWGIRELLWKLKKSIEWDIWKSSEKDKNDWNYEIKEIKGAYYFDYTDKDNQKREIVIRKSENEEYGIRIKKRVTINWKEQRQTQKQQNWDETFKIRANDKDNFNIWLWKALDTIIKNREKIPQTGWQIFDKLNVWWETAGTKNKDSSENKERKDLPKGLKVENGIYVYTVQKWDCESVIIEKLKNYIPNLIADKWIKGFNFNAIPDKEMKPGLEIIVPTADRIKEISEFKNTQLESINWLLNNNHYKDNITKLINSIKKYYKLKENEAKNYIARVMTAYAWKESSTENSDVIGEVALYRYESWKNYRCASYWYHHMLDKKEYPSGKAFKNLNMSKTEACTPKGSWMMFLAYCIEKSKEIKWWVEWNLCRFFQIKENPTWCWKYYNWSWNPEGYWSILKKHFEKIK